MGRVMVFVKIVAVYIVFSLGLLASTNYLSHTGTIVTENSIAVSRIDGPFSSTLYHKWKSREGWAENVTKSSFFIRPRYISMRFFNDRVDWVHQDNVSLILKDDGTVVYNDKHGERFYESYEKHKEAFEEAQIMLEKTRERFAPIIEKYKK